MIYPDGKVAVWNKSGWSGELHWEHVAVSERIHAAGVEKVKPLAAIYINVSDYEDPFVTFSSSNNSYFYPKYLRHHGDNNVSRKQSDIMFNALPTVDRIIYDNREVSRNEWEDENVSSNQLDIPFENNKTKIYSRTPSGPQTANMEQG